MEAPGKHAQVGQVIEVPLVKLYDNPDNKRVYGDYQVDAMAQDMAERGVFGVILAYEYRDGFMIESGHRRKYAALKAGLPTFPVLVTEAPGDTIETRKRLTRANLYGRDYTNAIVVARAAEYEYQTCVMEEEKMREDGIKAIKTASRRAAERLEISESQLSRYRSLLKLTPGLQELISEEKIPWTAFPSLTTVLNEEQMGLLCTQLKGAIKINGADTITAAAIKEMAGKIGSMRIGQTQFDRSALEQYVNKQEEAKPAKSKRANGAILIKKGTKSVYDSLDATQSYIAPGKREEALEELKALSSFLLEKIAEIESSGFGSEFNLKQ